MPSFRSPLGTGYIRSQAHGTPSQFIYDGNPDYEYHLGEDWGNGSTGGGVYAIGDGEVVFAGAASGYGPNFVAIEHLLADGTSVTSYYGHMASENVYVGQSVSMGDLIGTVGNEGLGSGPHLHFSVFIGPDAPLVAPGYTSEVDPDPTDRFVNPSWFLETHENDGEEPPTSVLRLVGNSAFVSFSPFAHFQLVYLDGLTQTEIEVQGQPLGNWTFEKRAHTAENGNKYISESAGHESNSSFISENYAWTTLSTGANAANLWYLLENIYISFAAQNDIDYDLFSQNSNSFINSIMYVAGMGLSEYESAAIPSDALLGAPASSVNVLLNSTTSFPLDVAGSPGIDRINGGLANDTFRAMDGDDIVYGDGGLDTVDGGEGDDTLLGGDGDDTLIGGKGYDVLNGDSGADLVDYARETATPLSGGIYVNLTEEGGRDSHGDFDHLISIENINGTNLLQPGLAWSDLVIGSDANNELDGRGGNDAVLGGNGDDTLIGGTGFDWLTGGSGADLFKFDIVTIIADEFDVIWDLIPGLDSIQMAAVVQNQTAFVQEAGYVGIYSGIGGSYFGISVVGSATVEEVVAATMFLL